MKGDLIPGADHVAKLCPYTKLDEFTGRPAAHAFQLRDGESSLSVNWLELLGRVTGAEPVAELRRVYHRKFRVGGTAKIAVLQVSKMVAYVQTEHDLFLEVRHDPILEGSENQLDPSHAGIYNLPGKDDPTAGLVVGKLIAETVVGVYAAK